MKVTTASTSQSSDSVVDQDARRGVRRIPAIPASDHDREDRLRAGVDVDLVVVLQRGEDRGGRVRSRGHAPPPARAPAPRRSR